jgi:hypothetical protein
MRTKSIALHGIAILAGSMVATGAMAQGQLASAVPGPQREMLVFTDKGGQLSPTAVATVRTAAQASSRVTLVGRLETVAAVKAELQRQGVPAQAIVVKPDGNAPVAKTADGLSNPVDRKVEIKF